MRAPTRKDEQRQASLENILQSSLELFVKNGYRGTTIDQIAIQAGLTKGAIYFYFKTKEAIMVRLLDEAEEYVVTPIPEYIKNASPTADAKLVKFIHTQSQLGLIRPRHVLLLILVSIEFPDRNSEIGARVRSIYAKMYAEIERIVVQGQRENVFRTDLASRDLTAIIMASHDGVLIEWYRRPNELKGKNLANVLRATLLNGLRQGDETESA